MLSSSDIQFDRSSSQGDTFSDEALWISFKKGNELALSVLYKKHVQPLYAYGMHTCHDREIVSDCLQELFLRLWNTRDSLATVKAARPYLFKSFRRLLFHEISQRRKDASADFHPEAFGFIPSVEALIIDTEEREDVLKRLRHCIQSLTKNQREIIYLKFFNDLSYQEISEITETQVDSVYNLVSRTIELLRKKLQVSKPLVPIR